MVKRHILFIDDDRQTLKTVSFILEQAGYVVKTAEDGFAGIEFAQRLAFDLVLLDINMPHVDGYTILQTFQKTQVLQDIPIIMLTGRDDVKSVKKATEKGAIDYIIKPVKKETLLDRISNILGSRPQFKEISLNPDKHDTSGTMTYNIEVHSISESGMVFWSPVPVQTGETVTNMECEFLKNLDVQMPRLKIIECTPKNDHFEVYASFIEMPEGDIPKIRHWVIKSILKARLG